MISASNRRRGRYVKSLGIAAIIVGSMLLSVELYFAYQFWIRPRATNCFFHFNIQYRAGNTEVEDNIIQEPYFKLLQMFDRHPTWNFSFEMQAAMIERMMERPEFEEILNLTQKLNHRGQMEIICGLYSSQLVHAYPQTVMEWEFKHAYQILEAANLTRSRVLLCQEGQVDTGFANILDVNWSSGIDTILVSWQTVQAFAPPNHNLPESPVYTVENIIPGKKINFLVYDYLPKVEAGYTHSWNYLGDAEIAVEAENAEVEFDVDAKRLAVFEKQWLMLEKEGNQFFTIEQWLKHCEKVAAVQPLGFYMPESHWNPVEYNSSFRWMGNNLGNADDGEMIANNRRGYFTVLATHIAYDYFKDQLNQANKTQIEDLLNIAEKNVLLAMVTDTTGLSPRDYERRYGENHVLYALGNCSEALSIIVREVPWLSVNSIFQVDLLSEEIENISSNFRFPKYEGEIDLPDLPITIQTLTSPNTPVYAPDIFVKNYTFEGFNYKSLEVIFPGTWDWDLNAPIKLELTLNVNATNIVYSPSLTDSVNFTLNLSRNDYKSHPIYVYLPLSNGLIYIPDPNYPNVGLAIINNCSRRHTSLLWDQDFLRYVEIEGIHLNASYQIFFLEDVQLNDALQFAQRVNNNPLWIISDNITQMAGYSAYGMYQLCINP